MPAICESERRSRLYADQKLISYYMRDEMKNLENKSYYQDYKRDRRIGADYTQSPQRQQLPFQEYTYFNHSPLNRDLFPSYLNNNNA